MKNNLRIILNVFSARKEKYIRLMCQNITNSEKQVIVLIIQKEKDGIILQ